MIYGLTVLPQLIEDSISRPNVGTKSKVQFPKPLLSNEETQLNAEQTYTSGWPKNQNRC
jgi:hypothetical protein